MSGGQKLLWYKKKFPFTEWVQSEIDNYGCVSNEEAKAKYTELYGAPKAQNAWSKLCSRMRKEIWLTNYESEVT